MTESAKQSRAPLGDIRRFPSRPRKAFQNQARNRNTKLLFLPKGMSKNETNRSYYNKWSVSKDIFCLLLKCPVLRNWFLNSMSVIGLCYCI